MARPRTAAHSMCRQRALLAEKEWRTHRVSRGNADRRASAAIKFGLLGLSYVPPRSSARCNASYSLLWIRWSSGNSPWGA